ncbi:MAG: glycosyltransferase family 4 protein [Planctomycetes bacterium]|nr:glycosyltransferase family 4 protein [Planctomycetota bacterium]
MKIAIIHYHLNRGGVTRVIANQLHSLSRFLEQTDGEPIQIALLFDGQALGWPEQEVASLERVDVELYPVPELAYDTEPKTRPAGLAERLRQRLHQARFSPDTTVVHVHNHALGKNASVPGALAELARDGYPLLLQIHDFAEDFRPANYRHLADSLAGQDLTAVLYPQASHIHYAVLNRRDRRVLSQAGVEPNRLHWLPNPVPPFSELPDREAARVVLEERCGVPRSKPYALYPVRGIRRKNLGEALLWAAALSGAVRFGMTLAPLNPKEIPIYSRWKQIARELRLPFAFETGADEGLTFEENLAAADAVLTTSVAEGFGMVFLEAWLADRPLFGRNLPEITADFIDAGLKLDNLYSHLMVPVDWAGPDEFREALAEAYGRTLAAYGLPAPGTAEFARLAEQKMPDGWADFADLDEPLQHRVLERVATESTARDTVLQRNKMIARLAEVSACDFSAVIAHNQSVIEADYSIAPSGRRLHAVYEAVHRSPRADRLEPLPAGESILQSFLGFDRFRLIRA